MDRKYVMAHCTVTSTLFRTALVFNNVLCSACKFVAENYESDKRNVAAMLKYHVRYLSFNPVAFEVFETDV